MPVLQTVVVALVGAAVFERLRLPAGALVGAMVAVAALNLLDRDTVALPGSVQFLAFAALGWAIGHGVTTDTLTVLRRSTVPLLVVVVALIAFGGLMAAFLTAVGWTDGITAFLAASPGALSQMSALADTLGANAPLVAAVHTVRVVVVVLSAPFVARLITGSA